MMKVTVREADPRNEREDLLRFLRSNLTLDIDEQRLEWLYFANPHGRARVWVLEDKDGLVGAGAAIPRRVQAFGSQVAGCIFGDFCILPTYRTIGPALQLQRACMQAVDSGWTRLAYDLPSASMMAVYRRLGIRERASLVRMAKPLRVNRQARKHVNSGALARLVYGTGNAALKASDRIRSRNLEVETTLSVQPFSEEFDELRKRVTPITKNWCIERSSDYLNWRFWEHPKTRYSIWTTHQQNRLEAYAITHTRHQAVQIADFFGTDSPGILESLLMTVVERARATHALTLSAFVLSGHPWQARLEALGFYAREASPVVTYGEDFSGTSPAWLTEGDRDS
jgi:hypothetical protein